MLDEWIMKNYEQLKTLPDNQDSKRTNLRLQQHELFIETLLELREAKSKIEQLECEIGHMKMEGNACDCVEDVKSCDVLKAEPTPEPKYRNLEIGEIVQLGDEVFIEGEWIVVPAYVGVTVVGDIFRRLVHEEP